MSISRIDREDAPKDHPEYGFRDKNPITGLLGLFANPNGSSNDLLLCLAVCKAKQKLQFVVALKRFRCLGRVLGVGAQGPGPDTLPEAPKKPVPAVTRASPSFAVCLVTCETCVDGDKLQGSKALHAKGFKGVKGEKKGLRFRELRSTFDPSWLSHRLPSCSVHPLSSSSKNTSADVSYSTL